MIPKLVSAIGLLALIAGSALLLMAYRNSTGAHAYELSVSPDGEHHKIDGKPPYFELSFAGSINWDFTNTTGSPVTVKIRDFESGHTGGCPVKFVFGGDGSAQCSATQTIPAGEIRTITAERGDSDPDNTTRYEFRFYVNEWPADPDIEIERDPFFLIYYIVALVGVFLTGVGWWLGRQKA